VGLSSELLYTPISVCLPFIGIVILHEIYRDSDIIIYGYSLLTDIIILSCDGFGLILGYDWLSKHYISVNCTGHTIRFDIPDVGPLYF